MGDSLRWRDDENELCRGDEGGEMGRGALPLLGLEPGGASLKMWTVSVADETQRRVEVALKEMQKMRAGMLPRRN